MMEWRERFSGPGGGDVTEVMSVTAHDFTGAAERDGRILTMWIKGNADRRATGAIERLLARVHAEAVRLEIAEAIVDLRQLERMSASCLRNLLTWLAQIHELAEDSRYKVKFVFHPGLHWQRRSPHDLRCFAIDLVSITEHR